MSDDFDKYLAIANLDIQMVKDMGELKSYVASLVYDNDKKVDMIHELEEEIERLNNIINELENYIKVELKHVIPMWSLETDYSFGESTIYGYILNKLQELKGSDKE